MYQIFFGSIFLSIIHVLIPNHWMPLIAISKTENWTLNRTLWATAITGFAHTLSTIIVGIIVGIIGYKLSMAYQLISTLASPLILAILGIMYIVLDFRSNKHHHEHKPFVIPSEDAEKSKWKAILTSLSVAMFLTPCLEIEAYYFQAGSLGWLGIFMVSAVYLILTIAVMLFLVYLGLKGTRLFKSQMLEHHDKLLTGIVLIALGLIAYFVG